MVLRAVGWEPTALDVILDRTGQRLGEVAVALDRLVERGLVRAGGGWWERVKAPRRRARAGPGLSAGEIDIL